MEAVPVSRLDFTAVLPRVLSLYVMSFLNPLDLSAAAQVSWHWRFLAEQVSLEQMGVGASAGAVGQCPPCPCPSIRTVCGTGGASREVGSSPTVQEPESTELGRTTTSPVSPCWTGVLRPRQPPATAH